MTGKCKDCSFSEKGWFNEGRFTCKRYPPQLWIKPIGFGAVEVENGWPTVSAGEWCGEFKRREKSG